MSAPTLGRSETPVSSAPGDLMPLLAFVGVYMHAYIITHRYRYMHIKFPLKIKFLVEHKEKEKKGEIKSNIFDSI